MIKSTTYRENRYGRYFMPFHIFVKIIFFTSRKCTFPTTGLLSMFSHFVLCYRSRLICYELASIWKNVDLTNEYDSEDLKKVTTAVCILASVAYSSKGDLIMDDLTSLSIMEILMKHFSVGTERTKHSERSLLYPLEYTPLASLCEKSIFKIAEERMTLTEETELVQQNILLPFKPKY